MPVVGQRVGQRARRRATPPSVGAVTMRSGASTAGSRAGDPADERGDVVERRAGRRRVTQTLVAADLALEARASPRAMTRAVVDDHDVVGEAVGLLEVLGGQQDRRALGRRGVSSTVPQLVAGARVEAGGGLVEEQDLGPGDQRGGQVEPPAHAARVVLGDAGRRRRSARTARAARRRAPCAARRPRWCSSPIITRFSRPVSSPSTVASWAARPMRGAPRSGRVATSKPATRGRARVGLGQRGEDAHRGGLAGAVGPEQRRRRCRAGRRGRRRRARSSRRSA